MRRYFTVAIQTVQEFKELTFQYQSNGAFTVQLFTNMPGGALASRITANIGTSNNERKPYTLPLDNIEGSEFYFKFTPGAATQLRLFSGNLKLRMIGLYLDGSLPVPEYWTTTPIALGA